MTMPGATPRKTKDEILNQLSLLLSSESLHATENAGRLHITFRRETPLSEDEQQRLDDWVRAYEGEHRDASIDSVHMFEIDIPDAHVRQLTPLESALEKLEKYFTPEEREALRVYELDKAIVE